MRLSGSHKSEKLHKALFIIFIIATVVSVHLLNRALVDRYFLKLDLTENSLYEFSETTHNLLRDLPFPVEITVLSPEKDFVIMLREILKRYDKAADRISLKFADPYENPLLVERFREKGAKIKGGEILIEGRYGFRAFSVDDMYLFNVGKTRIVGLNAEQKISSALVEVNTDKDYVAAFTDGHNERPSDSLMELYRQNAFRIARGPLRTVLEQDPNLLVITAPTRDFLPEEVAALEQYLEQGGSMMVFLEPAMKPLRELESLLGRWGIVPGDRLVFEEKAYTGNNPINIVPMYSPHGINRAFLDTRVFMTMPSSRNLKIAEEVGSAYDVSPVLNSTHMSYGKSGYQFKRLTRESQDMSGPFYLALTSVKDLVTENGLDKGRLFVIGSRNLYADDLLGFASYANSDFLVQTINWLSERDDSLSIPSKDIRTSPLNIQRNQAVLLGAVVTLALPAFVLLLGAIVYIRRKRLA